MIVNLDVDVYTKSENTPKNTKNNNPVKTKRLLKTEIYTKWEPGFDI